MLACLHLQEILEVTSFTAYLEHKGVNNPQNYKIFSP